MAGLKIQGDAKAPRVGTLAKKAWLEVEGLNNDSFLCLFNNNTIK